MLISSYFKRGLNYVARYPSHFAGYFGFGLGLGITTYYAKNSKYEYLRMGYAGSFAQIATEFFFHPIDVINTKTKIELIGKMSSSQMIRNIYRNEGFFGFLHGLSATYYGALIGGMIYFSTYKFFKKLLMHESNEENGVNFIAYLLSSSIGEFLFLVIYYPFDLIRTRMQIRDASHGYNDVMDGFKKIIGKKNRFKGFRKLYTGATPSFILNISNQCMVFTITESMREYFKIKKNLKHVQELSRLEYHTCSITAGALSGAFTNILEVITVNKQIQGKRFNFRKFIKEHGVYAFKAGIFPRMIINTLHTVTLFTVVDKIALFFNVEL